MLHFLGLLPAILFFGVILYAVIDPESVEQAQQRVLERWGEPEQVVAQVPAAPVAPRHPRSSRAPRPGSVRRFPAHAAGKSIRA